MSKCKILITGGGGMVGRNFLDHPLIHEFEILAPRSYELNLNNYSAIEDYLRQHRPDIIIHAAGKVGGIHANLREPVKFLIENLDMGRNIVYAARQTGIRRLLNLGSSCMYPRNYSESLVEEMVLKGELEPSNEGYALAKIVTAKLCDFIRREDENYQYKTLIPCNLYGKYDNFDAQHSHLIPAIVHKIHIAKVNSLPAVEIWGDGTARREFMYASDLADALIRAVNYFESVPEYMNIGLGHDYSINEFYQKVADVIGYTGQFTHNLSKPVGMNRKMVSVARQADWGWSPSYDLINGLKETYSHYLKECQR